MKQLLVLLVLVTLVLSGDYDGPKWQNQTGFSKFSKLCTAVKSNTNSAPWPSALAKAELFIESMDTSFDFVGDDFPKQGLFNLETRQKLIHSVGSIMPVTWEAVKNGYTGAFQGATNVLLRFSVATEINTEGGPGALAPGIALKFMRDNAQSGNVFAMYSLLGQSSMNFFKHDLTNHVPDLPSDAPLSLSLLRQKFATASAFPVFLGLSELASRDESGKLYQTPIFPFRIQFHPNKTLHNAFSDNFNGVEWEDLIEKAILPGQHVYDVYAQSTPTATSLDLIARVYAKQSPTRSYFADKTLFYQHTRFESDLKYYPSWEQKAKEIIADQRTYKGEGYHYPDLPWN